MARSLVRWVLAPALGALLLSAPARAVHLGWERVEIPDLGSYAYCYVPTRLDLSRPAPAIVFLHGSGTPPELWQSIMGPVAEQQRVVLIMPRAAADLDFGIGADDRLVAEAIALEGQRVSLDPARIGIAGHSAGAAYAIQLAYDSPAVFDGVFAMSAPYRTVIRLADPSRVPPVRFWYGDQDLDYTQGDYQALSEMLARLGVPQQAEIAAGKGHSGMTGDDIAAGFAFLLAQPVPSCVPSATALCLQGGRFRVEASWDANGAAGSAGAVKQTSESGYLWFFDEKNAEVTVKVLDGCAVNQRLWVYAAGMTDVHVVLTVTDTRSGAQRRYENPAGHAFTTIRDVDAFAACGG